MSWILPASVAGAAALVVWLLVRGVDRYDDDLVQTFAGHPCRVAECDGHLHGIAGGCDLTDYRCDGPGGHGHRAHVIRTQDGPREILLHREADLDRPAQVITLNFSALSAASVSDRDVRDAIDRLRKARRATAAKPGGAA